HSLINVLTSLDYKAFVAELYCLHEMYDIFVDIDEQNHFYFFAWVRCLSPLDALSELKGW
ncbi:MAG: hypothetical protein C6W58_04065, partial [Bacillaceae bacterium]